MAAGAWDATAYLAHLVIAPYRSEDKHPEPFSPLEFHLYRRPPRKNPAAAAAVLPYNPAILQAWQDQLDERKRG